MIKIKSSKYKNIIFKKKIVIKKFSNSKKSNSKNEIEGHNFFLNKGIFKLIKIFKIIKNNN